MFIDFMINGLLFSCVSVLFTVDVGFDQRKLVVDVKDHKAATYYSAPVNASIKGDKWELNSKSKAGKIKVEVDLKKSAGVLELKTKQLDVETLLNCK